MEELQKQIDNLNSILINPPYRNQSENLNELFTALSKAQLEILPVKKNCKNPFYNRNYANLMSVVEAARPALCNHGLCVIQLVESTSEGQYLRSRLCHSSGQWIESRIKLMPIKPDIQSLGAYLSYVKRYLYGALIGVVDTDEDDSGEGAMPDKDVNIQSLNKDQLAMLETALKDMDDIKKSILNKYRINDLGELPLNQFNKIYKGILELKQKKENNG